MGGEFNGVPKLIQDENFYAFYVYCFAAGAYQRLCWSPAMTPADAKGVAGISWTTNKFASARNTAVEFYPGVYQGVIYISAEKAAIESAKAS